MISSYLNNTKNMENNMENRTANTVDSKMPDNIKLEYNTQKRRLLIPEYGRNVQKMIEYVKSIEDRDERNRQAQAVIDVMEIINPQVHLQENYKHKLWDHMFIIADFDLDVDSPYPMPEVSELFTQPGQIPINKKPVKATYYGRNIESFIDLVAEKEEGEVKTAMIRSLANYMRQQYLTWNKDTVTEDTIFQDIERLSDGRIKVPEDLHLSRYDSDQNYRPMNQKSKNNQRMKGMQRMKNNRK